MCFTRLFLRIQARCLRRSITTTSCRYLLYLMSLSDLNIAEICHNILVNQTENSVMPFCVPVTDVMAIVMNYGTVQERLWPAGREIHFPPPFVGRNFETFEVDERPPAAFPKENLKLVLQVLRSNTRTHPLYTEEDKENLFHLLLCLAMAKDVYYDYDCLVIIKGILTNILFSYTDEEWQELSYKKVSLLFNYYLCAIIIAFYLTAPRLRTWL